MEEAVSKIELKVNSVIAVGMVFGAVALFSVDVPMTNFLGLMLFASAIVVAGISYLEYRLADPEQD